MSRKKTATEESPTQDQTFQEALQSIPEPAKPEKKIYSPVQTAGLNNVAGVQVIFYSSKEDGIYEAWLKFRDGKPSEQVRQIMKDAGFKWNPQVPEAGEFKSTGGWTRPVGYSTAAADRLVALRTYDQVGNAIATEKNLGRPR